MSPYSSEDDLPELSAILAPKPLMATGTNSNLRRSPRKKGTVITANSRSPEKKHAAIPGPAKASNEVPIQQQPKSRSPTKRTKPIQSIVDNVPLLSHKLETSRIAVTSNNRRSPARAQRPLAIPYVDAMLLSRSATAKEEQRPVAADYAPQSRTGSIRVLGNGEKSMMSLMTEAARKCEAKQTTQKKAPVSTYASRFVLKEARCNDDEEDSVDEEDEDEDTDLSGFIVDDDAELSYHDSSEAESEAESRNRSSEPSIASPRRRLHRGSPTRRRLSFLDKDFDDEKENKAPDVLADALRGLGLGDDRSKGAKLTDREVIDLTSSPNTSPRFDQNAGPKPILTHPSFTTSRPDKASTDLSNPFDDFDAVLKLAPPSSESSVPLPSKSRVSEDAKAMEDDDVFEDMSGKEANDGFKTPPNTPPRSKLKSPSKLLSPSKRQYVPQSPHRPSMDAFWDHNVINDWNDEFSPKKVPAKSPRKGLAQFQIYSDSEDDEDATNVSSDSLPSPCSSPRKSKSRPQSPLKSPEKAEKRRLIEQKKAAAVKKKEFDACKGSMALDLFHELDTRVAKSRLSKLAASTGGVQIIWSKTLRSTAGRANWKRTANKVSGSPIKGGVAEGPGIEVKHFASIELAEKIIDCEDRLVNTLAHEFCHLTNFMVSNVRDQPHGASFKTWASKVTGHLRNSNVEMWRKVEVTTKHSYVINHKYLWVCAGREKTQAMAFLNIDEDEGCGAEYGRHSKSIDTVKHRCGRCKGKLVQVRPRPRAPSPRKNLRSREGSAESVGSTSESASSQSTLGMMVEMVELSD